MRTLRFHRHGDPLDVLRLEDAPAPSPGPGRIRVAVRACGLNPADAGLCKGLFPGQLPRGIGLDVAGVVDALGDGVTSVAIGDRVVGAADYAGSASAGASELAILEHWARLPSTLDFVPAAALPLAVATAHHHLELLGVTAGQTVLIHGAGTMMGFAAVQMALRRGARVFATAGATYADRLRALGAQVTTYGDGMVERILALAGAKLVDLALDAAPAPGDPDLVHQLIAGRADPAPGTPIHGALPDLIRAVGGDPRRVLTMSDFRSAAALGVRTTFEGGMPRYDILDEYVQLAADGKFTIPVARTFALDDWRAAIELSQSGHARGKLVLLPT